MAYKIRDDFKSIDDLIEFCPDHFENEEKLEIPIQKYCIQDELFSKKSVETIVVYVCYLCFEKYSSVEKLKNHVIEFHKLNPIKNQQGKEESFQECNTPNNVKEEFINTTDILSVRAVPFNDFKRILRTNMLLACTNVTSCRYKFETQSKLQAHEKCHKISENPNFKCTECGVEIENWRRCSIHLWKTHGVDVDLMQCPLCTFRAASSVLIWRHMRTHKKWRSKVLKSIKVVRRNKQAKYVANNANLQDEEQISQTKETFNSNKNKYYSEKTCEICCRKFANGKTLSKHVKTVHNKIKPFICNVCGKKTARKSTLIVHMRQHSGEKNLQCKNCKFTSRDPSVLRKHQMRHEKLRKHKCPRCPYSSIQTGCYKRHVRINHPEEYKKIACKLCNFVTISAEKLEAHLLDHRKGLIINNEDSMDATRLNSLKNPRKTHDKNLNNTELSSDCFLPLESVDSMPHEPTLDTGGVTILHNNASSDYIQFPTFLNN